MMPSPPLAAQVPPRVSRDKWTLPSSIARGFQCPLSVCVCVSVYLPSVSRCSIGMTAFNPTPTQLSPSPPRVFKVAMSSGEIAAEETSKVQQQQEQLAAAASLASSAAAQEEEESDSAIGDNFADDDLRKAASPTMWRSFRNVRLNEQYCFITAAADCVRLPFKRNRLIWRKC